MERLFLTVFLISLMACPSLHAKGAARSFSTTGSLGGEEEIPMWFYKVQPLPQTPQKKAQQPAAKKGGQAVVNLPAAPAPKSKSAKDKRQVYDQQPVDKRKVVATTERDKPPVVASKKSQTKFESTALDRTVGDPHARNQSVLNARGIFQPLPVSNRRRHTVADWP